jgi:hypothetical protein
MGGKEGKPLLMVKTDDAAQLLSVEELLIASFADRLPRDVITEELERTRQEYADSRVRTFIPVLVQRRVTDNLRSRLRQAE